MKFLLVPALCLGLFACSQTNAGNSAKMKTQMDSISYAIGCNLGNNIKSDSLQLSPDLIAAGIKDALGGKVNLTDAQMQQVMMSFQQQMMAKQASKAAETESANKASGEANKIAGEKFLAENAKKPGVVTLPSGLQYQVIQEGTGPTPKATDSVVTRYRGTLLDGTEFDSSERVQGGTVGFRINEVIKGWTEALQLMKVGSKWKLFIPSTLAYGEQGAGPQIGPNATLVFDIELVSIGGKQ